MNFDPYLALHTKMNPKWIRNLNKYKTENHKTSKSKENPVTLN